MPLRPPSLPFEEVYPLSLLYVNGNQVSIHRHKSNTQNRDFETRKQNVDDDFAVVFRVFFFSFLRTHLPFFTALNNFSHNSTFANGFAILFTYGRTDASLEVELFFESLSDIFDLAYFFWAIQRFFRFFKC